MPIIHTARLVCAVQTLASVLVCVLRGLQNSTTGPGLKAIPFMFAVGDLRLCLESESDYRARKFPVMPSLAFVLRGLGPFRPRMESTPAQSLTRPPLVVRPARFDTMTSRLATRDLRKDDHGLRAWRQRLSFHQRTWRSHRCQDETYLPHAQKDVNDRGTHPDAMEDDNAHLMSCHSSLLDLASSRSRVKWMCRRLIEAVRGDGRASKIHLDAIRGAEASMHGSVRFPHALVDVSAQFEWPLSADQRVGAKFHACTWDPALTLRESRSVKVSDRPPPYLLALQLRVQTLGQVNNNRGKFQARTLDIPSCASSTPSRPTDGFRARNSLRSSRDASTASTTSNFTFVDRTRTG
ncbi:hypothetical protein EXIGLDRAFT_767875 [Exidia glandulosa HHB12029]|uniref:Uncharacterized protein n=1 Tax=Exidia glandulosa HHB12029 TaxID=1314781 RepID=A0A165INM8_EXIGL|nr:hypothetical protein EXIGLDRAFT_767875 [Exidia glandulosa HHB12029]